MRLTRQSSYAMRTLMYCALNEPDLSRVSDIAVSFGMSEAFLFKLIKPLVQHGLLRTVRGRKGGLRLAKPADEITLLSVVRITEDSFSMAECFDGATECPLVGACDLNSALDDALQHFFGVLESYTIGQLVARRQMLVDRLGMPASAAPIQVAPPPD